ncbi:MAG: hypothetical protein KAQ98_02695 [Bacteriovoracaceae bacterium]|nr:hypothetical protein [Bacteriovoracaceae bacterium]
MLNTDTIRKMVETIGTMDHKEYIYNIDGYRRSIERYIENKKRVCSGEFSTIIVDDEKGISPAIEAKRLDERERKLCFKDIQTLQINFINKIFEARKRYLFYLHKIRLKELSEARESVIKNLKESFEKRKI